MNEKYNRLVRILYDTNNWVKANVLASKLDVSVRSVKTYVSEINSEKQIIISSNQGYIIDKKLGDEFLNQQINSKLFIPQTPEERKNYLIKLFITSIGSFDLYDLSDSLYISPGTLKSDLIRVKKYLTDFDVRLIIHNDTIYLEGLEKNKRRVMISILYSECNNGFVNVSIIQKAFKNYDINYIKNTLTSLFKKYRFFVNDYSLSNLVVSITITIDRIKNNNSLMQDKSDKFDKNKPEYTLAASIAQEFEQKFNIRFNEQEIYDLTLLLLSSGISHDYNSITLANLENYVGKDCVALVYEIIEGILDYYYIHLNQAEFIVQLATHINNLVYRAKSDYCYNNPLKKSLKESYPLIYELAVFIADKIMESKHITINDDEIGYIAFDIGAALEGQKSFNKKIKCAILFPQYYNMNSKIIEKINNLFNDALLIVNVFSSEEEINSVNEIDLLITTIGLSESYNKSAIIQIEPFLNENNIMSIFKQINEIQLAKRNMCLKSNLNSIFSPDLFEKNSLFKTPEDIIRHLSEKMCTQGCVNRNFVDKVLEREKMSSTSYNNIAIPHTIQMSAKKTSICVLINEKPISWGSNSVNLVLLLAVNINERKLFNDIYQSLTEILMQEENLNRLLSSKDYDEFINVIVSFF